VLENPGGVDGKIIPARRKKKARYLGWEYPERMIEPRPPELVIGPLDDYVVIQPSDEETETRAGLIIPASAENSCRSGVVTAVGNDADSIEPGDKVLFPKDAGYEVRLAGTAIRVIRRRELIARIHD